MGCWYKTCGLSNLHIYPDTEVAVFVLERNNNPKDRCYSTAFWAPAMMPFWAEYDEYGGGNNARGIGLEYIMESLKTKLIETDLGDNKYHDIEVKREDFDVTKFFEAVHENRLDIKSYDGSHEIDFVMIRKDIIDHLLANFKFEKYVGGKDPYVYYGYEDILADVPEFLDRLTDALQNTNALKNTNVGRFASDSGIELMPNMLKAMAALGRTIEAVFPWDDTNRAAKFVTTRDFRYSSLFKTEEIITDLLIEGKRDIAEQIVRESIMASVIDGIMEHTRRNWAPGGHEGSQAQELHGYKALIAATSAAIAAEEHESEEFNAELDEEEQE